MSRHWILDPRARSGGDVAVSLAQATALLQKLGLAERHAVAEDLLRLIGTHVPLAQCTIFAFEGQGRPRTVAVGDRSRTQALRDISDAYVSRFYRLDGSAAVMRAELAAAQKASASEPRTVLHRQRADEITHPDYRHTCYELPQLAERLAILALFEGRRWLSVNLYRGVEHGPFDDAAIAWVEAFAPLVVHAVRLHHTGQALQHDVPALLLARLVQRAPQLTQRDHDVVRGLMEGCSTEALAQRLGLTPSSAQTYVKRVCRKLGVSGQRELLALLIDPTVSP
jgi:DNA-binding CsgD family transcriptional regulator